MRSLFPVKYCVELGDMVRKRGPFVNLKIDLDPRLVVAYFFYSDGYHRNAGMIHKITHNFI